MAADNGIIEEGVSSCPIEYTSIVSEAMLNQIACIGIFTKTFRYRLKCRWYRYEKWYKRNYPNLIHKN